MEARVAAARAASNRGALPSASMRVKEDAVKAAQLLHDPSKTHELYANEREGRAAGGGRRSREKTARRRERDGGGGGGELEIPPANGERVYVPVKSTVVLDPPPRRTGDRAFAEGHGSDQPAGKVARRRLRARLKGGDGASFSAGFETGYDHGKDSKSQADAVASTASTANKIGRSHADAGGGKGDAGGDGACVTERVEAIVVAACRFQNSGARAFCTLVPIRPRSRGERRSLRTLPGASLRPPHAFNPRPRRLSTPPDAFELHLDNRSVWNDPQSWPITRTEAQ